MARIFISHSSADNDQAAQMKAWLASAGFESAFLDKDKTTGIPPGADWERTLYREVEQSQAVIIIQTPNWLASKWCFAEFTQARALGKAIFPAIVAPTGDTLISPDIQALNLLSDRDGGLDRLKRELVRIALDAQGGFEWDAHRPPFPGMLAFDEADAAVYFGRDDDIRRLIERLDARRAQGGAKLIALLGSSGSGKSSLLRAGVIPRLKRAGRNWIVVPPMRPRLHPIDELATALAAARDPPVDWAKVRDDLIGTDPGRALEGFSRSLLGEARANEARILIPIDQAEELFGVADRDEARRFMAILSQALSENLPFMAVMTIRSDFLGQLQSAASLTARFEEFSLGPMPLARIPQIVEGPARRTGLRVEDEFVQQAAHDAETQDALPLLAFTLRQLFDRSTDGSLTLQAYKTLGDEAAGLTPLENAVRKAADTVLDEANATNEEKTALREAFVPAMVRVNEQGEYVRRPARMEALPPTSHPLLERLAKARLLVIRQEGDARLVEVAHEALLRKWPWLKEQLDAERVFLIGKQQLEQDLRDWQAAADKDKADALLSGLKLTRARTWLIEHPTRLTAEERAFVQASVEREEAARRKRERTRWIATAVSVAVAVAFFIVAVFAVRQMWRAQDSEQQARGARDEATASERSARQSEQQAKVAQKVAVTNESKALTALSQAASQQDHYTDAVKLALAAWPRSAADERPQLYRTIEALGQALSGPLEVSPPLRHEGQVNAAAFTPDGARVVTVSGNAARLWDAATGVPIGQPLQNVLGAALSTDGALVVIASGDKTTRVWDAATGTPLGQPLQHYDQVTAFSSDGKRVVTGNVNSSRTAELRDAATGATIGQSQSRVISAAFSSHGDRVVIASRENVARLLDAATGAPIGQELQHESFVLFESVAFSPDGKRVLATGLDSRDTGKAWVWDAATGAPLGKPLQHKLALNSAAFSLDGAKVVTASNDGTARVWDAATGAPIGKALQHDGPVTSAAFSADGTRVVTGSKDKTARLWDAATGAPIGGALRHDGEVTSVAFSLDSARVMTVSGDDNTVRIWNATTWAPVGQPMQHESPVVAAAFSPDGARVITASEANDGNLRIWNAVTGAPIGNPMQQDAMGNVFVQQGGLLSLLGISPDGARLATASGNAVWLWDAVAGAPIGQPLQHEEKITSAAFSPDGARVVTASGHTVQVWDAASGAPIGTPFRHDAEVIGAVFSPDSARVMTISGSGRDNAVRIWNMSTGAAVAALRHEGEVYSASFSVDGRRVVTADGKTARLWDAATLQPIGKPLPNEVPPFSFLLHPVFSPDGTRIVTSPSSDAAQLWDAATATPIGQPLKHTNTWNAVFSSDSARLVTTSDDKTARLWDAATGAPFGKPLQHDGKVNSAAFSPDGTRLVTTSSRTARLWDAATGAPIGQPLRHEDTTNSAAFSPDGARVVTASRDKTARVWRVPVAAPNIIATACKMLGSNHDLSGLAARYGVEIKDPICASGAPAPDPSLMIEH